MKSCCKLLFLLLLFIFSPLLLLWLKWVFHSGYLYQKCCSLEYLRIWKRECCIFELTISFFHVAQCFYLLPEKKNWSFYPIFVGVSVQIKKKTLRFIIIKLLSKIASTLCSSLLHFSMPPFSFLFFFLVLSVTEITNKQYQMRSKSKPRFFKLRKGEFGILKKCVNIFDNIWKFTPCPRPKY